MSKVFNKLQVFTKTPNFREAVKLVTKPLIEPKDDEVRVKIIYTGLNATDINITAARYFTDGKIPFDIGLEVKFSFCFKIFSIQVCTIFFSGQTKGFRIDRCCWI